VIVRQHSHHLLSGQDVQEHFTWSHYFVFRVVVYGTTSSMDSLGEVYQRFLVKRLSVGGGSSTRHNPPNMEIQSAELLRPDTSCGGLKCRRWLSLVRPGRSINIVKSSATNVVSKALFYFLHLRLCALAFTCSF